jgi:hypothetical protein
MEMSAKGQQRTFAVTFRHTYVMSALPPKTDIWRRSRLVGMTGGNSLRRRTDNTARLGFDDPLFMSISRELRARAKIQRRAVIKRNVAYYFSAPCGRLIFQYFVGKFVTKHLKFDLVERAIISHITHPFVASNQMGGP